MKKSDPDFVTGSLGSYDVQPPIVHPPYCVCAICPRHRKTDADWSGDFVIRARKRSPHPSSRVDSATFARTFKAREEARLREEVAKAEAAKRAKANAVTFGRVCDAYRIDMKAKGKRYDRTASRIDNIEAFFGRGRDAASIGWDEYQELIGEVALMSAQTQRHYASTLIAMLNFAVKYRILSGPHKLGIAPRPVVQRSGAPVVWTKQELAVILGPAIDHAGRRHGTMRWQRRSRSAACGRRRTSRCAASA